MSVVDYKPGDRIDKWVLDKLLGQGGMGAVYFATHHLTRKRAAFKVLKAGGRHAEALLNKMVEEAIFLSQRHHDNLVEVYDAGVEGGIGWMAMELLKGCDVAQLIAKEGPLDVPRALRYAEEVASAVSVAHEANIIHRDLKPENIFITVGDRVDRAKVLDFGASRFKAAGRAGTFEGQLVGSVPYMAPEHLRGEEIDGRIDVYALGLVLYVMLAGRYPFDKGPQDDMRAFIRKIFLEPLPSLETGVGAEVWGLILRATAKDKNDRFATMSDFAAALQAACGVRERPVYAPTERLSSDEIRTWSSDPGAVSASSPSFSATGSSHGTTAAMTPSAQQHVQQATAPATSTRGNFAGPAAPSRTIGRGALIAGVALATLVAAAAVIIIGMSADEAVPAPASQGEDIAATNQAPTVTSSATAARETADEPAPPAEETTSEPSPEPPPVGSPVQPQLVAPPVRRPPPVQPPPARPRPEPKPKVNW